MRLSAWNAHASFRPVGAYSPTSPCTIVVVEIDAAPVALGPPVEAADAKIRRAKVVVTTSSSTAMPVRGRR